MLCRSCTRSFIQRLNIYKKFKQLEEPTFQRVSNQCTQPPLPFQLERYRHKLPSACPEMFWISHPWHARGGRAAKRGTQVRPSGNVNCKNNSSDCNQLSQSPTLTGVTGAASKAKQFSGGGADRKAWWGNTAFQA